jgi:zinc protease
VSLWVSPTLAKQNIVRCVGIAIVVGSTILASPPSSVAVAQKAANSTVPTLQRGQGRASKNDSTVRDPALTEGTLPNGLRYYLRNNSTPAKQVELRLVVNAGSMQEDDDQQGFAHFLEHMAFNGTANFPRHALIEFIEHSGMNFGADLNAYTSFDETVYMLTLPTQKRETLDKGLQILHDWASGKITIDSSEVVAERGVVLGEWRSRLADTATQRVQRLQRAVIWNQHMRYLDRLPIGKPTLLATAQPGPIRRFYQDWYRPDLMAIVVVGDFDKVKVLQVIREQFGSIPMPTTPRPRITSTPTPQERPVVEVIRDRVSPSVQITWKTPARPRTTEGAFRQSLVEQLLFGSLQRTFLQLRQQDRRPFVRASIGRGGDVRAIGEIYALGVVTYADSLEHGLTAALTEIERIAQLGVAPHVLSQDKAALLRQYESGADRKDTEASAALAKEYVQHYLTGAELLLNASQRYALARRIIPAITSAEIAKAAQFWRDSIGRTVLYNVPAFAPVAPPTRDRLETLFSAVQRPIRAGVHTTDDNTETPLIATAPTPGRIVSEKRHTASGVVEWTLSNKARVLYKPTNFNPDELFINAHSAGGTSLLHDSLAFSPGRLVGSLMTAAGGLGDSDRDQLLQQLNTTVLKEFRVSLNFIDEEIALAGSPKDIETIFQLLYLQFTAPKLDTAALSTWKRYGGETVTQTANDQIASTLSYGNPRLTPPNPYLVPLMDLDQAMAVYRDRFGDAGDFTFTIVGAAPPERIKPLVEQYIASLPSHQRAEREQPKDPKIPPLNTIQRITQRVQPVPRATTMLVFDGLFPSAPDSFVTERQRMSALTMLMSRRLRNELREHLGGTYSVGVSPSLYANPQEHYQIRINFDAAPDRIDTLIDVMMQQIDSIRTHGASAEELTDIMTIQRQSQLRQLQSNRVWMQAIQQYDRLGIPFDKIVAPTREDLTPEQLKTAAQRYLPSMAYIHMTYLPRDKNAKSLPDDPPDTGTGRQPSADSSSSKLPQADSLVDTAAASSNPLGHVSAQRVAILMERARAAEQGGRLRDAAEDISRAIAATTNFPLRDSLIQHLYALVERGALGESPASPQVRVDAKIDTAFQQMYDRAIAVTPFSSSASGKSGERSQTRTVLGEYLTGVFCGFCWPKDRAYAALLQRYPSTDFIVIGYHNGPGDPIGGTGRDSLWYYIGGAEGGEAVGLYGTHAEKHDASDKKVNTSPHQREFRSSALLGDPGPKHSDWIDGIPGIGFMGAATVTAKSAGTKTIPSTMYDSSVALIDQRLQVAPEADVVLQIVPTGVSDSTIATVRADVRVTPKVQRKRLGVRLVLVEDTVRLTGLTNRRLHYMAARQVAWFGGRDLFFPLPENSTSATALTYTFDVAALQREFLTLYERDEEARQNFPNTKDWRINPRRLGVVAIVQDRDTKEVLQTVYQRVLTPSL